MAKQQQKVAPQRVGLRYIGNGSYLPGLPARDLGAADLVEYAAILAEMEQAGTLGLLYEEVTLTSSVTEGSTTEGEGATHA